MGRFPSAAGRPDSNRHPLTVVRAGYLHEDLSACPRNLELAVRTDGSSARDGVVCRAPLARGCDTLEVIQGLSLVRAQRPQIRAGRLAVGTTAAAAACGLLVSACASSVTVNVRNDTGAGVRIAGCVDDSADVGPDGAFDASGVPQGGQVRCDVATVDAHEHCVAIQRPRSVRGTVLLSRLTAVRSGWCP